MSNQFGPRDMGVIACKHVAEGKRAINLVTRYSDGDWAFTCGQPDHSEELDDNKDYALVHIAHLVEHDGSIEEVSDLTNGWSAERNGPGNLWRRYADPA